MNDEKKLVETIIHALREGDVTITGCSTDGRVWLEGHTAKDANIKIEVNLNG